MTEENQQLLDQMFKDKVKAKRGSVTKDEIVCVVDRSGSMESIRKDAQGGLNSFVAEQQKVEGNGANFTLVEFDSEIDTVHNRVDIQTVKPYKLTPRGSTALLDAIGTTINSLPNLEDAKVIFVVITDGGENSSKEYTREQVFKLIEDKKALGWEFLFLAANQDAITTGTGLGFDGSKCVNYSPTEVGTQALYSFASNTVASYRSKSKVDYEADLELLKSKLEDDTKL